MNLDHNSGHWIQKISSFPFIFSFHWLIIVQYKPFLFKNLLWASSKAKPIKREHDNLGGNSLSSHACRTKAVEIRTLRDFQIIIIFLLVLSYVLASIFQPTLDCLITCSDFPVVNCTAMVLCTFPLDSSWTIALCCRCCVVPCQCWGCTGTKTSSLEWRDQKAAYSVITLG